MQAVMFRTIAKLAAWACLGFIIFATLVPLGMRPTAGEIGPNYERFVAYAVASTLMVLAYPRRAIQYGLAIVAVAVLLEICQLAVPDRDARISDAMMKMAGALSGMAFGIFWNRVVTGLTAGSSPDL